MFRAGEHTSVGSVGVGNEFDLSNGTDGMSDLHSTRRHAIRDNIVGVVHVLVEEGLEFMTDKEFFSLLVSKDVLPDELLFAQS